MKNEIIDRIYKLNDSYLKKDTYLNIKIIHLKIEYYEFKMGELYKTKPHKFQRKKLNIYNENLKGYLNILNKLYNELSIELEKISNWYEQLFVL